MIRLVFVMLCRLDVLMLLLLRGMLIFIWRLLGANRQGECDRASQ
jgi:hypothetical protein